MKPIRLSGHAQDQLGHRGTSESEIVEAIETVDWEPADLGRLECRKNFEFNSEWNGLFYATKQVRPIFVEEQEEIVVGLSTRTTSEAAPNENHVRLRG